MRRMRRRRRRRGGGETMIEELRSYQSGEVTQWRANVNPTYTGLNKCWVEICSFKLRMVASREHAT